MTETGLVNATFGDLIPENAGPFLSFRENDQDDLNIAPIMPPRWMPPQFKLFETAVSNAKDGQLDTARKIIATIRNDDLRAWFVTALYSGTARFHALGKRPSGVPPTIQRDKLRISAAMEREVLARDGYRCRYCCKRIIVKEAFEAFQNVVGRDVFCATGTDKTRHGIVLVYRACADHVIPWTQGGATSLDNLIAACWPCNFAKSNYTLNQIGVPDPREYLARVDEWDGLVSAVGELRKLANLAKKSTCNA